MAIVGLKRVLAVPRTTLARSKHVPRFTGSIQHDQLSKLGRCNVGVVFDCDHEADDCASPGDSCQRCT